MMKKRKWLQKKIAVCLCGGILYTSMALANPTGMAPVAGNVTPDGASTPQNMVLNILGKGAVINWDAFSILSGEKVHFQMDSSAAVLNRVVGNDLSRIAGTLRGDGKVFLVNPHGIVFANGATINAPLFVASTLDVNNDRFMAYANGTESVLPFAGLGSSEIRVEGNTNIGTSTVALLGNTVTVAPGVTLTSNVNAVGSPTGGAITAVAAEKVNLYETSTQKLAAAFQAQANNAVNVGGAVSDDTTVQAQTITLAGGAVNIQGTADKPTKVHNNSGNLTVYALGDAGFTKEGSSTATPDNAVSIQNAQVGMQQNEEKITPMAEANLSILGGSINAVGSRLDSNGGTVLVAASTIKKSEMELQNDGRNKLTIDVVNKPGNTIMLGKNTGGTGSRVDQVHGQDISMSAYNIDMMGANVESYQGNISFLAGKMLKGTFAPKADSFTAEAEQANGIVIGDSKVSSNANGTSSYLRILGAGGKIVFYKNSEVSSDNGEEVNQGGVGLLAYSKLTQESDGTSVYLNGKYESLGGNTQNYVKIEKSSIAAGDINLVGNAIKNGGALSAKNYLGVSLEAAASITQNNTQQTRVATITADNKITNTYDGFNGNITSDIGDIMVTGYGIENNGSIHSDSGTVAVMALDKVSGSGSVTPGTGTTHVISGATVTERKEVEFNTREADGSTGEVITKSNKLIIDPTKKPLTTVTMAWNSGALNTVTIDGKAGSVPAQPEPGVVPPGTPGSVPEQPAPGVVPPGTPGSIPEQPAPGVVPPGASMEALKRALEAANLESNMEAKKELLVIIFTSMKPHEYQEAIHYLLDLQNGPGTFVRGQNQSRQGLMRESQRQQTRQMRNWAQIQLGSALEALKSKENLFIAPGVSFSPMPRGPERIVAPPQRLPQEDKV